MTHLFAADEADGTVTEEQFARLDAVLERVKSAGLKPEWLNVGNSAALLGGKIGEIVNLASRFGMKAMLRPGLALYGLAPKFDPSFDEEPAGLAAARVRLKPVLSWKTAVIGVRAVPAGSCASRFAQRQRDIAIAPPSVEQFARSRWSRGRGQQGSFGIFAGVRPPIRQYIGDSANLVGSAAGRRQATAYHRRAVNH